MCLPSSNRRRPCSRLLAFVLLFAATLFRHAEAQSYTTVVVFGDSLSDTGNIANLTQSQFGIRFPSRNVLLGFNYADGRFTDGPLTAPAASAYSGVWIEQLTGSFPSKPPVTNSLSGGTNYAYGDATTNDGTTIVTESGLSLTLNNMGQQVTDYLATNPTPTAQTLYVLWGGSNDVYADASAAGVSAAVAREAALVQRLVAAGATKFLVPNLPPLGGVPDHASNPATAAALNMAAASFDAQLAASLTAVTTSAQAQGKTVTILQPDIFGRFSAAATNPSAIGLANVSAAAQGIAGNPDTYLIWDGLHPTTTGHHYVAAAAAQLITPLVASTTTLSLAPRTGSQGLDLRATVQSSMATAAAPGTPATGLVTFFNNGTTAIGSGTLSTVNGIATVSATYTGVALTTPYSITAVYAGDTTYTTSISAAQVSTPVATTTVVTSSALNGNLGAPITFTANIVTISGSPTGTITFEDGTTILGTPVSVANGAASYTTSALAAGAHTITARYNGDANFAGSTSASITETITAPSFTASLSPTSLTVARGASGTTTVTITSVGGFSGTATLACGSVPAHLSCTFAPASISFGGSNNAPTATLTIATNASAALIAPELPGWSGRLGIVSALLFPGFGFLGFGALRRRRRGSSKYPNVPLLLAMAALSAVGFLGISGCGGGSNNAATGTYTVPVTATGGNTTSSVNLTVIVQ